MGHKRQFCVVFFIFFWEELKQEADVEIRNPHSKPILSMDFDSVGFMVASGDSAGTLSVANLYSGQLIARVKKAHDKGISCVTVLGSTRVITAGFDKAIRLYKLEPVDLDLASLRLEKKGLWDRIFTSKKKRVPVKSTDKTSVSSSFDRNNAMKLTLVKELRGHKGEIYCMKVNPAKTLFATGATDKTIIIYDFKSGECLRTLKGHNDTITCIAFKNEFVYSASLDCTIKSNEIS